MSEWYYAHGGEQKGPVPVSELQRLAGTGEFDPAADLVWRDGMPDWKPAGAVEELGALFQPATGEPPTAPTTAEPATPASGDFNPYAAPAAPETVMASSGTAGDDRQEIPPGSDPLQVGACISRGFELMKANLGMVIAVVVIFGAISWTAGSVFGVIEGLLGGGIQPGFEIDPQTGEFQPQNQEITPAQVLVSIVVNLINQLVSVFLALGMTRIGLNIVDGREFSIGMLFGEAGKLVRAFLAGLLYGLAVAVGLVLLIVPGIYIALRYGQYQAAIVDRDMGVMESLAYSSRITEGQKWPLLGLAILSFLIVIAGVLALCVGVVFAYPIVWLAGVVAYRWMQYGSGVVRPAN
jgi:hypothetical protein